MFYISEFESEVNCLSVFEGLALKGLNKDQGQNSPITISPLTH